MSKKDDCKEKKEEEEEEGATSCVESVQRWTSVSHTYESSVTIFGNILKSTAQLFECLSSIGQNLETTLTNFLLLGKIFIVVSGQKLDKKT